MMTDRANLSVVENEEQIKIVADRIARVLVEKGRTYGSSWKSRGGQGAFFVGIRKADRIENIVKEVGYDLFAAMKENRGDIVDDIEDLAGYAILWLTELEDKQ